MIEKVKKMSNAKWLSKELLSKSLKNYYKAQDIEIINFDVKPAVPTGDCFTSDITRVHIEFIKNKCDKKETTTVIVKCQPRGKLVEKWTTDLNFFKTEMEMFSKTFPKIYEILGPKFEGYLSPKCLLTTDTPNLTLVLEDLKLQGFGMTPRQNGFDMEHCLLVMKKLATFHATSVVMVEQNRDYVKNYAGGIYTNDKVSTDWIYLGFQALAASCKKWKGFEKYGTKIEKMGRSVIEKTLKASTRDPTGFNVLNHGDMWTNNMLFTYDSKKRVTDTKLIDFQLVKYSSPALDLHYFTATSPTEEVRERLDILLDVYYGHLLSTLASLHYSLKRIPSRKQIQNDFECRAFYGLCSAATVTPLVKASQRDDATFDDMAENDGPGSFKEHSYTNENYTKALQQLLPYYDSLGIFNENLN